MTLVSIVFESKQAADVFEVNGGLNDLGLHMEEKRLNSIVFEYRGVLSTRLWNACRDYVEVCGGQWAAVSVLLEEQDE